MKVKKIIQLEAREPKIIDASPLEPYFVIHYRLTRDLQHDEMRNAPRLDYKVFFTNDSNESFYINVFNSNQEKLELPKNKIYKIEFETFSLPEDCKIELEIYFGREQIEMKSPFDAFSNFLDDKQNTKVIFSAPFGQGKTTFLKHFFNHIEQKEKYEVFSVFPVNYSVATNEDIFKYIKIDILFQLLKHDINFEKYEINYNLAWQGFLLNQPKDAIGYILKGLVKIGVVGLTSGNVVAGGLISKLYDWLKEGNKRILQYKEEFDRDDKADVLDYIKDTFSKEGSIYEDDFYTQFIRDSLSLIKEESKKENVLIIEDLDRMDPDHIFRILNVISAHYDTYKYLDDVLEHNKFGFDKIVVVCDLENIKSIFQHRYGEKTDFQGYINKGYTKYFVNQI